MLLQPELQLSLAVLPYFAVARVVNERFRCRAARPFLRALQQQGVNAFLCDGVAALITAIHGNQVDRVFNILHGGAGENGEVAGLLAAYSIPVTGSGVLGAALSMDKVRSKQVWQALNLPTADFVVCFRGGNLDAEAVVQKLGLPLMVKPAQEGSTVGATRVYAAADLSAAVEHAARFDSAVMIEKFIVGVDVTVAILAGDALPSIRIEPASGFYDYHAKYLAEDTEYVCPGVVKDEEVAIQKIALQAFDALACKGWGRVDFMRSDTGDYFLLEVNTTPGMTDHSLVPMAAAQHGVNFEELVWRILQSS